MATLLDSLTSKALMVLHSIVHAKRDEGNCKKRKNAIE